MIERRDSDASSRPAPLPAAVLLFAAAGVVLHLLPRPGYGFHRDELLYLAMGDHLDLFRMQFPPVIAVLAQLARALPIDLLVAIHLASALASAAVVLASARIAARLGGNSWAQLLTALAVLVTPLQLRAGALFQPVIFEVLWWTLGALAFVSLQGGVARRWWLALGLAAGLGASTKFTAAVFGLAMLIAVIASPLRRDFGSRWPWLAAALAGILTVPAVTGQMVWGWPFLVQMRILRESQLERVTPGSFLSGQLLLAGAAAPILVLGIAGLVAGPTTRQYRGAGIYALVAAILFLATGGKEYYLGPVHPLLLAGGSVGLASLTATRPTARWIVIAWLGIAGLLTLPLGIPLLPPPAMAAYSARVGLTRAVTTNWGAVLPLPQDYADMLGWREQAAAVARAYETLDPAERMRTSIVGGNYGRAGALAVYHEEFGLPYPISRHGDFYRWGPGNPDATTFIIVGGSVEELSSLFEEVELAATVVTPMGVPEEQEVGIHICRRPRQPLLELWRMLGPVWG